MPKNKEQNNPNTVHIETSDSDFKDSESDNEDNGNVIVEEDIANEDEILKPQELFPIICKVRKIVKIFKRSPTKNDILQKYVLTENKTEYMLILDSKTRWNSSLLMKERFWKLKNPIQKAMIVLNLQINFSDSEFDLISRTISALLPIKLTVEALCRIDPNLLTVNATINFMLQPLKEQHTSLSEELYITLKNRIERHTEIENVLRYLHNFNDCKNENEKEEKRLTNSNLIVI
ncbi:putative AC transposase [Caerostris darwini]|uniref:AC transposase n=1 Tax=Caerostris darwini TaxID=1538125 RepID=A0AAV4PYD0_9ARAC|nr:putative AC transposase [Caerostris darwini]